MRILTLPAWVCLLMMIACSARGQEWTRFRGPNGSGQSEAEGIPTTWTEAEYNWKVKLPGRGHSSPVLWGERLFLLSADSQDASRYVLCLDANSGKTIWRKSFHGGTHPLHHYNTFASSSPAVDAERVYVAWANLQHTTFMALTHEGKVVWEKDLGPFASRHGFGNSPVLFDDLVILVDEQSGRTMPAGSSFIYALDRGTGELRWKAARKTAVVTYSAPCIYRPKAGPPQLILCSQGHGISSLDPWTGKENWEIDVFRMRCVSTPIIVGNLILGTNGSGGGGNYVVAVRPGLPGLSPEVAYRVTKQAPYVPSLVAHGQQIFLWSDRGVVTSINGPDGRVIWQKRVGGNFFGSPVRVQDRIYCIDSEGTVAVISAGKQFKLLGKTPLGEPSRSTPAIAGGRMYLRTESHLTCIGRGRS